MGQISCGCTLQRPDPACRRGSYLFEAAHLASHGLIDGITAEERGVSSASAHHAYMDHVRGWCEEDVKVQRKSGGWILSVRFCGRWIVHVSTPDESFMREWLFLRGYEQLVRDGEPTTGYLAGYYRKGNERPSHEHLERLTRQRATTDTSLFPSQSDLKTQVTIFIALLIASIPHLPTRVERLLVQQRATALLRTHGIPVGPPDEQTIRELIDEAIRQKERIHGLPVQNTRGHQR